MSNARRDVVRVFFGVKYLFMLLLWGIYTAQRCNIPIMAPLNVTIKWKYFYLVAILYFCFIIVGIAYVHFRQRVSWCVSMCISQKLNSNIASRAIVISSSQVVIFKYFALSKILISIVIMVLDLSIKLKYIMTFL